jgi:hypothetical protein
MTSIDVATGDLSALAGYGGGRSIAPRANRASAALEQPGVTTLAPEVVGQLVAAAQQGGQASPAAPPITENAATGSDEANPPNRNSADTVQPAQ